MKCTSIDQLRVCGLAVKSLLCQRLVVTWTADKAQHGPQERSTAAESSFIMLYSINAMLLR